MDIACSTYGEKRVAYRIGWGSLRERGHLEDVGLDGEIVLKWVLKRNVGHELYCSGSGLGQVASCCECGNELLCSIKCGEFVD